jgi:zinc protease
MFRPLVIILIAASLTAAAVAQNGSPTQVKDTAQEGVTRSTLANGLRVVIVRDPLAPVVTVEENYLVGANETPPGFPGMAHAQEHMAFRGCADVSADQIAAIYAQLGGYDNADTQQTITQYFTTIPAADLEIALRIDAACMRDVVDSNTEWQQEKGAIQQEVARDLSEPTYKFITRLNEDMFAGTPYAHDALGSRESFEKTTGAMLKAFYQRWYAPNNAILVIAGDIDADATLATVKRLYGAIPRRPIGTRPRVNLRPVTQDSFTLDSNLPYTLAFVAYRLPGTESSDYAAARVMADVLASQRGDLYALVPAGKALYANFDLAETFPKASVGFSVTALPAATAPDAVVGDMRSIVANYVRQGFPAELVEAAKRQEIASALFRRNSISDLASVWSQALAAEGRNSPDENVEATRRVTTADVNRVAMQFLKDDNSITATLVPKPSNEETSEKGFGGGESLTSAPTKPVQLPVWAETALASIRVPNVNPAWSDVTLPNKIRVIVKSDKTSPTVTLVGNIRHETSLQEPSGKDGASDVLDELFSYGTTSRDRLAFQKALDDIAASATAGYDFSLRVPKPDFGRGVELLADNVLHPALPSDAFNTVKQQTAEYLEGQLKSPGYQADRALKVGLLPPADPDLREAKPQSVSSLTLDDVRNHYQTTFRPDLTTIVVIGDVDSAEVRGAIEKYFGAWRVEGVTPDPTLPPVAKNMAKEFAVADPQAVQASVTLAQEVGLNRFDPDYYALQVGNNVLGGGFYATRLYHDLRQVAGLVYTVDDSFVAGKTRSVYTVTFGSDPPNVAKARDLILRDLRAMQTENVSPAELHQAKALLLRQMALQQSSEDAIAGLLLARAQIGLPLDESRRMGQRYYDMTADEVRAAFARWIRPQDFVQVIRGPSQ